MLKISSERNHGRDNHLRRAFSAGFCSSCIRARTQWPSLTRRAARSPVMSRPARTLTSWLDLPMGNSLSIFEAKHNHSSIVNPEIARVNLCE